MNRAALLLCTALIPSTALADVTPRDVWQNWQAYFAAMGGTLQAELTEEGSTLTAKGFAAEFNLPMGFGQAQMTMGDLVMQDNGDGTVTMIWPDALPVTGALSLTAPEMTGDASFDITLNAEGNKMLAKGQPGDIEYSWNIPSYDMVFNDFSLSGDFLQAPELAAMGEFTITAAMKVADNVGTMRITEGDLVTVAMDGGYGAISFDFAMDTGAGLTGTLTGSGDSGRSVAELALPAGGTALTELPAALRAGLRAAFKVETTGDKSFEEMRQGDEVLYYTRESMGRSDFSLTLGQDGVALKGTVQDHHVESTGDMEFRLPFAVTLDTAEWSGRVAMPLLQADAAQDAALVLRGTDVKPSEDLWALIDPAATLPREPVQLNIDLAARISPVVDLLNFPALEELDRTGEMPVRLDALDIAALDISAAGAAIAGAGGFTFDNTDLTSFEGMPAPTGVVDFTLNGINTLIDQLIALGVLSNEDAMGGRMMLGMFARPVEGGGEDALTSKIEIDGESGQILANGQRLK